MYLIKCTLTRKALLQFVKEKHFSKKNDKIAFKLNLFHIHIPSLYQVFEPLHELNRHPNDVPL